MKTLLFITGLGLGLLIGIQRPAQVREPTTAEILQVIDNHADTLLFYPPDAVIHLQKGLTAEGFNCAIDGILGAETITKYNEWKERNR